MRNARECRRSKIIIHLSLTSIAKHNDNINRTRWGIHPREMVVSSRQKSKRNGSRKNRFGVQGWRNQFSFGSKTIAALVTGALFVYFLGFLGLAVRVHHLDHVESSLLNQRNTTTGTIKHQWNADNNEKDKRYHIEDKKNDISGDVKRNEVVKTINNVNLRAKAINQVVKEQETRPMPVKNTVDESTPRMKRPGFRANPHGHMVAPDVIVEETKSTKDQNPNTIRQNIPEDQILTAYIENTDRSGWGTKPLPVRNVKAEDLEVTRFPRLSSCSKLPEQWPVDDYPDDPFLPWIHDVFPTEDGKFIQFVAQNRRRCHTGTTREEEKILEHTEPQVALFQHVPLKKLESSTEGEPRYRLSSHEDADPESIATRFICRFKPSGKITFSEFNNDYEWTSKQKRQKVIFHENGKDNYQIHTSQLIFRCPVPDDLTEQIRTGESVQDDWATLFVDLIPVRTPPRYGIPDAFLVPHYAASVKTPEDQLFNPHEEWGEEHILPKLEDSGRWENIPICKPSLMTYEPEALKEPKSSEKKTHHLVSCLWASTGYTTRGNRYAINDGQRRMLEWITFNKILGFDHFYIYDNSGAFTNQSSLQPIADIFPADVTVIDWPSRVCNNNPNNVDSVGERSSQYAAESSCRLRFGSHVNWIGQFDIDEYLIPMGNYSSLLPLLEKLDDEGKKIISFASWRAWPRRTHIK
jgi:hypothetical protein